MTPPQKPDNGVSFGNFWDLTTYGGYSWGNPLLGGRIGTEAYLGRAGPFDFSALFRGGYTVDNFERADRQDFALLPREASLWVGGPYFEVRGGRIQMLNRHFSSIDGAEVTVKPIKELNFGGFVGKRNEVCLNPEGGLDHCYNGTGYGVFAKGGYGPFGAQLFFQGAEGDDVSLRQDLGGMLHWEIIKGLSIYGKATGSVLMESMLEAEGRASYSYEDLFTVSGYVRWNDPKNLLFDADSPWVAFDTNPFLTTGGDFRLRLAGDGLILNVGANHSSTRPFGVNAGAQVNVDGSYVRGDFGYSMNSEELGGGNNYMGSLSGALNLDRWKTLAAISYTQNEGSVIPLYNEGKAVGFYLDTGYDITDTLALSARGNASVWDKTNVTGLLVLTWSPRVGDEGMPRVSSSSNWEDVMAKPEPAKPVAFKKDRPMSVVIFPVHKVQVKEDFADSEFHSLHLEDEYVQSCDECHDAAPKSMKSSDVLSKVDCTQCHDDDRKVDVSWIPTPRINFPHKTHIELKDVTCLRCHAGADKVDVATRDHLPKKDTCVSCHTDWQNTCDKCHLPSSDGRIQTIFGAQMLRPNGNLWGITLDHTDWFMKHGGHGTAANAYRGICVDCHSETTAAANEPAACSKCHDPAKSDPRTRYHVPGWPKRDGHGLAARADDSVCKNCHRPINSATVDPGNCASCHQPQQGRRHKFHDAGWMKSHSFEARADQTYCSTCHGTSTTFCNDCHSQQGVSSGLSPIPGQSQHPVGWLSTSGGTHGPAFQASPGTCATCHQPAYCTRCHTSGGIAFPGGTR